MMNYKYNKTSEVDQVETWSLVNECGMVQSANENEL